MAKSSSQPVNPSLVASLEAQIATLTKALEVLKKDNDQLAFKVEALEADRLSSAKTIEELTEALARQKRITDQVLEKFALANARLWAPKGEQADPNQLRMFTSYFNDAETYCEQIDEPESKPVKTAASRRSRRGRTINFDALETVVIDHFLEEGDDVCPECGTTLSEFKVEVTKTLKMVPTHLVVEEHRRHVYVCESCSKDNACGIELPVTIKRAPIPSLPIPKSFASPSLIAHILYNKYVNSMPLYRIEKDFESLGIELSRQTQANWVINVYRRWLSLLHTRMKDHLLKEPVIHADETEVQVLNEQGRAATQKSRMWLFAAGAHARPNFIFEYHPSRSGKVAQAFLEGFSGYLTTDGYEPYFNLGPDIQNTACLVHIRRKFKEVLKGVNEHSVAFEQSIAKEALAKIAKINRLDNSFETLSIEERAQARRSKLAPLLEELLGWVRSKLDEAIPKMALHRALSYASKYLPYTQNVCQDGRLSLDNNLAERAIRPFTIGRKNWLFTNTPVGAAASAAIYSITTTARACNLNVGKYLEWLLTVMPNAETLDDDALDKLLPFSEDLPSELYLSEKAAEKQQEEMNKDPLVPMSAKEVAALRRLA